MGYFDTLFKKFMGQPVEQDAETPSERSPLEEDLIQTLQRYLADDATAHTPIRLELLFTGRVQGVGFRWSNQGTASSLKITGSATNLDDGSVAVELQGEPGKLIRHLDSIHRTYANRGCRVWLEKAEEVPVDPAETEFKVRY